MARRKKSSSLGLLGIIPVVVIILAAVFMFFYTPKQATVVSKLNAKENISATDGGDLGGLIFGAINSLDASAPTGIVSITDTRDGILNAKGGSVAYYSSGEHARAAYKKAKENKDEGSYVWCRGTAVYSGSKECFLLYLGVLF